MDSAISIKSRKPPAYPYLALDDPEWEEGQAPHEIGRAQFGRISIANTDSEAIALMDAAFDAAWRAVQEQTENFYTDPNYQTMVA